MTSMLWIDDDDSPRRSRDRPRMRDSRWAGVKRRQIASLHLVAGSRRHQSSLGVPDAAHLAAAPEEVGER